MSQIVERFADAVQALVGEGPIKNRLNKAYSVYLADLQQIELPVASKHAFGRLHSALHSGAAIGRADSVTASVQKMSPDSICSSNSDGSTHAAAPASSSRTRRSTSGRRRWSPAR